MKFDDPDIVILFKDGMDDLKLLHKMLFWKVYFSHLCIDCIVNVLDKMSLLRIMHMNKNTLIMYAKIMLSKYMV